MKQEVNFEIPDIKNINNMDWIPASVPHVFMVGMVRYFNWSDKEVFEMGKKALTISKTLKIFLKYTATIQYTIEKSLKGWPKYYSWGVAELVSFNKNKGEGLICLRDFETHPVVSKYLEGVFTKILEIASGNPNALVKEVKNESGGKNDYFFQLSW